MKGKKTWRLSRTLKRNANVRPIEHEDIKYAGAAYAKGALGMMGFPPGLRGEAFREAFEQWVILNAHAAWTISTHTPKGFIPTGFALGRWVVDGKLMFITGIAWFPWASCRNIVEGTVEFFNGIRKQFAWIGEASDDHRPLYDVCCKHGIMGRIGTSHSMGQKIAVFEGRT